jgi:Flp pilus assembly protein TadG
VRIARVREERGASAVEFAIIASLLLLILFGTITFGIVLNRYQGLQAGGREGARLGSLTTTTLDQIRTRTRDSVSIISGSNIQDQCSSPLTVVETGCILIQTKQDGNADGDTLDADEVQTCDSACPATNSSGTAQPCDRVPSQGRSVYVEVRYRLRIDIPLWASPQMTISGSGEFQCE